jgi:hypothetical protein
MSRSGGVRLGGPVRSARGCPDRPGRVRVGARVGTGDWFVSGLNPARSGNGGGVSPGFAALPMPKALGLHLLLRRLLRRAHLLRLLKALPHQPEVLLDMLAQPSKCSVFM